MAVTAQPYREAVAMEPVKHLFTAEEYEAMAAAGLFPPDQRLELIDGEVVEMTPIGPAHAGIVNRLNHLLGRACGDRAIVSVQNPLRLSGLSEPQPDLALLSPRPDYYAGGHPRPGDVLLVIEVSESTLEWDRRVKVPLYAAAGVAELWVLDVAARVLEVYSGPGPDGYSGQARLGRGDAVGISGLPGVSLEVADLFG